MLGERVEWRSGEEYSVGVKEVRGESGEGVVVRIGSWLELGVAHGVSC